MKESALLTIALPISLAIIMFGMGLSLVIGDFKRVIQYPKATILGLSNQLIVLPIISFILCILFDLSPEMAVGLMILSACPGGPTSNLITYVSKGDTALSITMTAISSVLTIFTIPIIISYSLNYFTQGSDTPVEISFLDTLMKITMITVIPVAIGMTVKKIYNKLAERMEKTMKIISIVIFTLVILGIILANKNNLIDHLKNVGLVTLTLNIVTMLIGFYLAKLFLLNKKQAISITIETGIQNGTLAIAIATSIIKVPEMAIPSAIYALLMYFTGTFMMWKFGNRKK